MPSLINLLDIGITIVVPAFVWTLLAAGLFQLIRESVRRPGMIQRQVARETQS